MKNQRQNEILSIITNKVLFKQEELQNELLALGYNVTQSTVSRDIKELGLIKGRDSDGNYRYIYNEQKSKERDLEHFHDLFTKSVKSVDYALNNVVIKSYPGMASTACVALDEMFGDMMLGSLAGDDTIIIVTRSEMHSKILVDKINNTL